MRFNDLLPASLSLIPASQTAEIQGKLQQTPGLCIHMQKTEKERQEAVRQSHGFINLRCISNS